MGIENIAVREVEAKSILTRSSLPVGGYSANPYVGCPHACRYCYASFMKRFTGHDEDWGTFVDVKRWPRIKNPRKYAGQRIVIGSVTDGYNPLEKRYAVTRDLLEQLRYSHAKITICTKSDLVVRDLDLLTSMSDVTISWSINTLDESFKNDMDQAVSIERRLAAMKEAYDAGIRTVCFVAPIFPGITNVQEIIEQACDRCDFVWLENLNLRGGFKRDILSYIRDKYPQLASLYNEIYVRGNRDWWRYLEAQLHAFAEEQGLPWLDGYLPDGRSKPGSPAVINYFYHEEVRDSENTGVRKLRKG